MKGIQQRYGTDKFDVLLLSVDNDMGAPKMEEFDAKTLRKTKIDWPNVLLPNGLEDCQRLFNVDTYVPILVGPDGIVRSIGAKPDEIETQLDH